MEHFAESSDMHLWAPAGTYFPTWEGLFWEKASGFEESMKCAPECLRLAVLAVLSPHASACRLQRVCPQMLSTDVDQVYLQAHTSSCTGHGAAVVHLPWADTKTLIRPDLDSRTKQKKLLQNQSLMRKNRQETRLCHEHFENALCIELQGLVLLKVERRLRAGTRS